MLRGVSLSGGAAQVLQQLHDHVSATHRGQAGICTGDLWSQPPPDPPGHTGSRLVLPLHSPLTAVTGSSHPATRPPVRARWQRQQPRGGSYLAAVKGSAEPCPSQPPSSLLPLCRSRQGTTAAAPTPGEFPTPVSCFEELLKRGSVATKSALISSLPTRAGARTSGCLWLQRAPRAAGVTRGSGCQLAGGCAGRAALSQERASAPDSGSAAERGDGAAPRAATKTRPKNSLCGFVKRHRLLVEACEGKQPRQGRAHGCSVPRDGVAPENYYSIRRCSDIPDQELSRRGRLQLSEGPGHARIAFSIS